MKLEQPSSPGELDRRLALLASEEAPSRDLWPGIHAAISASPRLHAAPRRWPVALAAGLVLAIAAGYAGWLGGRSGALQVAATAAAPTAVAPASQAPQANFALPAGYRYLKARSDLEHAYREGLKRIAPATRLRIEADLQTIRDANADIQKALVEDPESPVLNRLMQSIWQQEFDLYSTVARTSDSDAKRTRT